MMPTLPVVLRPLAPHARSVVLKPYTAQAAVVVPNLGLRLLFPKDVGGSLTYAVTNPIFKPLRLGPSALLLTVNRGAHARYCGNVFINMQHYAVSLLVCTSMHGRRYTSDIIFKAPIAAAVPVLMQKKHSPWRAIAADLAFGDIPRTAIRKRADVGRGAGHVVLLVRRWAHTAKGAVLGFEVSSSPKHPLSIGRALLYRGQKTWRMVASNLACTTEAAIRCALVTQSPLSHVRRLHLVVVTSLGTVRASW